MKHLFVTRCVPYIVYEVSEMVYAEAIFAPLFKKGNPAGVAKLVDAPDLGSGAARYGGSSPSARTDFRQERTTGGFFTGYSS